MRRNKLVVASSLPAAQAAAQRQGLANQLDMHEDDVIVLAGVSGVAVIPDDTEPDATLHDLIAGLLEQNKRRITQGRFDDVATDIAWRIEHAGWHQG